MSIVAPEAIFFDLDGTLVNSEPLNVESVVLACRRVEIELTPEERAFVVGHSWNEIHARICENHGLDVPMADLIAWAVEEKEALVARQGLPELPHARQTVLRLGQRTRMAVVSGASRVEVQDAVGRMGLTSSFEFLFGAEDYQKGKPHPEPYQLAMARMGVAPNGCVVLEDSAPGIASGRAAGAIVVAVRVGSSPGHDQGNADAVVETLADVTEDLLASLLSQRGR